MREFAAIPAPERRRLVRSAFVKSLPVLMGYTTMGFAAGVYLAVRTGVSWAGLWSGLCGITFVSGTLSFKVVDLIADAATLGTVALMTLAINFRYAFYGFSMIGRWRGIPLWQKWFLIHSLADEIYALDVACPEEDPLKNRYYCLWNHALNTLYWLVGTTAGGFAGAALPIPAKGIEFAMVALFLVIFTDQMRAFLTRNRGALKGGDA